MFLPKYKLKATIVVALTLIFGVGTPLLSRLEALNLGDVRTAIFGNTQNTQGTIPGIQNENNNSTQLFPVAQQSATPQSNATQPSASTSPTGLECIASPATVYVGDQVTWQVKTSNIQSPEKIKYLWTGAVTGMGQTQTSSHSAPGVFSTTVQFDDIQLGKKQATCSINVLDRTVQNGTINPSTPVENSSQNQPQTTNLSDILTCTILNPTIILSQKNITTVRCTLNTPGFVTARIMKGDYNPPQTLQKNDVIKTFMDQKNVYDQAFSFNWNGIDSYDSPVEEGRYTFVITAQQTVQSPLDISLQKIQVYQNAPAVNQISVSSQQTIEEAVKISQDKSGTENSGTSTSTTAQISAKSVTIDTSKTPENSQCPGVAYPTDIKNHFAESFIKISYENCFFRGYADGTFDPEGPMLRAEAVKAVMVAAGIPPKSGCYDSDCGTPFEDLLPWQGQWIRAAYDLRLIKGASDNLFMPQAGLTRGQAAVIVSKAFNIPPHKYCTTPNCGAGYPNNFFVDVTDPIQGTYLRELWDRKVITGNGENIFEPDRIITRAQMAALIVKAAQSQGRMTNT